MAAGTTMAQELGAATGLVLVTVLVHYAGMVFLERVLKIEAGIERKRRIRPTSALGILYPVGLVLGLFVLHGIEIWLYAGFYLGVGAIESLRTAVYFSTMTYSSIGYSDAYIHADWRIVAAIEGINGLILIGWSTAFFVTFMNRLMR